MLLSYGLRSVRRGVPVFLRHCCALNQVIAMDCRGDSNLRKSRRDELQHCHLCRGILHSHSIYKDTVVICHDLSMEKGMRHDKYHRANPTSETSESTRVTKRYCLMLPACCF